MQINHEKVEFKSSGMTEVNDFGMIMDAQLFRKMSRDIYTNHAATMAQEYLSNAIDAVDFDLSKIVVTLPAQDNNYMFSVRDYGHGMSPEFMNTKWNKYGYSDKTATNQKIGGRGWGGKIGFAIANAFTVSCYDGKTVRNYPNFLDENGFPKLGLIQEVPCKEPQGVCIKVPCSSSDALKIVEKILQMFVSTYLYVDRKSFFSISNYKIPSAEIARMIDDAVVYVDSSKNYVLDERKELLRTINIVAKTNLNVGSVPYEPPNLTRFASPVYLHIPIGVLDINANRETLHTTTANFDAIRNHVQKFVNEFQDFVKKEFETSLAKMNKWEQYIYAKTAREYDYGLRIVTLREVANKYTFKGMFIDASKAIEHCPYTLLGQYDYRTNKEFPVKSYCLDIDSFIAKNIDRSDKLIFIYDDYTDKDGHTFVDVISRICELYRSSKVKTKYEPLMTLVNKVIFFPATMKQKATPIYASIPIVSGAVTAVNASTSLSQNQPIIVSMYSDYKSFSALLPGVPRIAKFSEILKEFFPLVETDKLFNRQVIAKEDNKGIMIKKYSFVNDRFWAISVDEYKKELSALDKDKTLYVSLTGDKLDDFDNLTVKSFDCDVLRTGSQSARNFAIAAQTLPKGFSVYAVPSNKLDKTKFKCSFKEYIESDTHNKWFLRQIALHQLAKEVTGKLLNYSYNLDKKCYLNSLFKYISEKIEKKDKCIDIYGLYPFEMAPFLFQSGKGHMTYYLAGIPDAITRNHEISKIISDPKELVEYKKLFKFYTDLNKLLSQRYELLYDKDAFSCADHAKQLKYVNMVDKALGDLPQLSVDWAQRAGDVNFDLDVLKP